MRGRIVLITGSSRGIGLATARLAKEAGAEVVLHGRTDSAALGQRAAEMDALRVVADVGDHDDVRGAVQEVVRTHGRIDSLINCAGVAAPRAFVELTRQDWDRHLTANLIGVFNFCQTVAPHMPRDGSGRIVNVSSMRGNLSMATARGMAYSASKAALNSFTVALAKELAPEILVNGLAPGLIETDLIAGLSPLSRAEAESSLLGRIGTPLEIAEMLIFLAGEKVSYMTGQIITADGGAELGNR
ncbi:3-oxoacyl-[acyl-carrier-protein] reductase FabG [Mycobacteroides salmoniphilum]|uniref:3-oxoacyl-[acyl-carrier-protein] reductase FabG n=1 Tax=Mycobacteroides salmoniphilum TaxID=404941 RepID=A0A4V3HYU3_9MYCO|nr:SDR family oxidoreductase [Mycobacteroides salmoniphilum]TDZ85727.1 3-oxoacyl-[acyl-carrier-protein] reductase FabG [Mycobacteroides salmoniphilum]